MPGGSQGNGHGPHAQRAIRAAHVEHAYTLAEIGRHLGIHYTTVSRIVNRD